MTRCGEGATLCLGLVQIIGLSRDPRDGNVVTCFEDVPISPVDYNKDVETFLLHGAGY
jgi:hypothetical protein